MSSLLPSGARRSVGRVLFQRVPRIMILVALIFFAGMSLPYFHRSHAQSLGVQNVVFNGSVVSGSIVADTIRPSVVGSVKVWSAAVQCDAGGGQLTITHLPITGGSPLPLWENASGDVTPNLSSYAWVVPLQGTPGEVIGFSITGCGVGSSHYILDLQYSVN